MTDNQRDYEKAICEIAGVSDIGDVSDGYHTFNSLYYQRAVLFAALVNQNANKSWKTRRHEDGELCFGGGWFLVTIDTPEGPYGYHYEEKYWDLFQCEELDRAKHWDGYTDEDVPRLLSLSASVNTENDGSEIMTNGDRIRHLPDEELAIFMVVQSLMGAASANGVSDRQSAEDIVEEALKSKSAEIDIENAKDWLKQEAHENDGTD